MIDRLLITDFSKNSVLWGIDGDWMVNYIKKNQPFFPTDHCGVLRVDEKALNPHFIMYMLEIAGRRAGFSRSYRASIDRIEGLTIPAVPLKEQNALMKKVEEIEGKINEEIRKAVKLGEKSVKIVFPPQHYVVQHRELFREIYLDQGFDVEFSPNFRYIRPTEWYFTLGWEDEK